MKYAFISQRSGEFSVSLACRVLGVSRSGYYDWRNSTSSGLTKKQKLIQAIEKVHLGSRGAYGSPRVYQQLKALGFKTSKTTIERLMRANGIRAKKRRRFCRTTQSNHDLPLARNVVDRNFDQGRANKVWLTDITYLRTRDGWAYMAAVMDSHTRRIVGWSIADHMRTELVTAALRSAMVQVGIPSDLAVHSDRGSQYASTEFRELLANCSFIQSMSRKGNCWDNAPMESFFDSLKTELVGNRIFADVCEARSVVFEWVEVFYNRQRLHSSLGYRSPACFEEETMAKIA